MENASSTHLPPVSPTRQRIGKNLYAFAWVIEVFAVGIGLAIALMMVMSSFAEVETSQTSTMAEFTNAIIAGLPFLMVAAVEITKIPFTEAFYYTTKARWKWVFGISLLFIAFITFESALNGFERNFTAMTYSIDRFKKDLVAVEEEIPLIEGNRERLTSLTAEKIEQDYNSRQSQLSEERQGQVSVVQERISGLRASIQSETAEIKRQEIASKRQQSQSLFAQRDDDLALENQNYQQQISQVNSEVEIRRRSLQNQLSTAQRNLDEVTRQARIAIDDASIFTVTATREREEAKIADARNALNAIRTRLNSIDALGEKNAIRNQYQQAVTDIRASYQRQSEQLEQELDKLTNELNQMIGSRERDIEQLISNHQAEIAEIEAAFALQRQENEENRERQYELLARNDENIAELDQQLNALRDRRLSLRESINQKVGDNQVFRMAQWAYGKESAADLKRDEVMMIAFVWFGSLAALIAFTGIILALAACVIRDPKIKDVKDNKDVRRNPFVKAANTVRRYFTYRRRIQRTPRIKEVPIEVVKEVPVERVKLTEKPVEIIKKELVHVPVYTNDEKLLKRNPDVDL